MTRDTDNVNKNTKKGGTVRPAKQGTERQPKRDLPDIPAGTRKPK